jgi:SAM-dependent methyltransferase
MTDLRQETIDTYNHSAKELAAYFQGIGSRVKYIEKAFAHAGINSDARVLEIGCGDGRDAKAIAPHCSFFSAFDISKELVRIAQVNVPEVNFQVADAVTFSYPEDLDVVFAFASLLHLDKDELKVVFQKATNSLRKGGIFYISTKYRDNYENAIKEDRFGKRLFYFYNRETIEKIAGPEFVTVESDIEHIGDTEWLEIALKKQ